MLYNTGNTFITAGKRIMDHTAKKTLDERKHLLAQALQTQVVGGGRIESQSDYQAVVITGKKVNHLLHFLVGFFTFGLWWLVWLALAIFGGEKRNLVSVDEFGNVLVQKV